MGGNEGPLFPQASGLVGVTTAAAELTTTPSPRRPPPSRPWEEGIQNPIAFSRCAAECWLLSVIALFVLNTLLLSIRCSIISLFPPHHIILSPFFSFPFSAVCHSTSPLRFLKGSLTLSNPSNKAGLCSFSSSSSSSTRAFSLLLFTLSTKLYLSSFLSCSFCIHHPPCRLSPFPPSFPFSLCSWSPFLPP